MRDHLTVGCSDWPNRIKYSRKSIMNMYNKNTSVLFSALLSLPPCIPPLLLLLLPVMLSFEEQGRSNPLKTIHYLPPSHLLTHTHTTHTHTHTCTQRLQISLYCIYCHSSRSLLVNSPLFYISFHFPSFFCLYLLSPLFLMMMLNINVKSLSLMLWLQISSIMPVASTSTEHGKYHHK